MIPSKTFTTFAILLVLGLAFVAVAGRSQATNSQAWLLDTPRFDQDRCTAFPPGDAGSEDRALFVCVGDQPADAVDLFVVVRGAGPIGTVHVETYRPMPTSAIDRRIGENVRWLEGWYHEFAAGHPVLPFLGTELRDAARDSPDDVSRIYLAQDLILDLTASGPCAKLRLAAGARQAEVDCVNPSVPGAAAASGLLDLSRRLGVNSMHLEAWSANGRFLRDDRFHRSADDTGRAVVQVDEFERRLQAAAGLVEIEALDARPINDLYTSLRRALVHGVPDEPSLSTFVADPEIYLLATESGATP